MNRFPRFSVIVPTHARPVRLRACLQALAALEFPHTRYEVIVVDDGGTLPPGATAPPAGAGAWPAVTLLTQPRAGPAAARNTGAAAAGGDFLAFTDDDCAPAPDWLRSLAARFATTPDAAIGGRTINALPDNLYSTASQLLVDYLYARLNADPAQARFVASNNLSLPTDRFRAIDGFDTTFTLAAGEDRELCDRWLAHGGRLIYAPEALVRHAHALTPVGFWRQQFHYGRGAAHIRRVRHAEPGLGHGGFEPASFYLDLLRYPASRAHGRRAAALVALMVLSQAAIAAGMLWEQTPRRPTRGVGTSG